MSNPLHTHPSATHPFRGPLWVLPLRGHPLPVTSLLWVVIDCAYLSPCALPPPSSPQSPVGVALGATVGHLLATGLAIVGGSLLSQYISERAVSQRWSEGVTDCVSGSVGVCVCERVGE